MCMVNGFEVRQFVSEFYEGGEVVVKAMEDDLGVVWQSWERVVALFKRSRKKLRPRGV